MPKAFELAKLKRNAADSCNQKATLNGPTLFEEAIEIIIFLCNYDNINEVGGGGYGLGDGGVVGVGSW